jgi:ribosomal protein S18 acetylase RimI-like enzyme
MRDEDLEECAEVIRKSFMTVAADFGLTKENSPTNGAFIQKERLAEEKGKGHILYGVMDENKIIGYMQLEKNSEELFYLQKMAVLPEYRHREIGTKLLDYAKEQVQKLGGKRISIGIIEENTVLKNWYLAYGFVPTGTKKFEHLPFTVGFMELIVA